MAKTSFAEEMKRHQLSWALANGVTPDMLEASLATGDATRCRLLVALLAEALVP